MQNSPIHVDLADEIRMSGMGVTMADPEDREQRLRGDLQRQIERNTTLLEQRAALQEENGGLREKNRWLIRVAFGIWTLLTLSTLGWVFLGVVRDWK